MPLFSGKGKAVLAKNISEMISSKTFAKGKSKEKKQQMAVAAAYGKSREKK